MAGSTPRMTIAASGGRRRRHADSDGSALRIGPGIDEAHGGKTAAEATAVGAQALAVRTGVTRWESVQAMVSAVGGRFGDVLVNNVGWTRDALFVEKTRERWRPRT